MAERIDIGIDMSDLSSAVAGLQGVSTEMRGIGAGMRGTAQAAAEVARASRQAAAGGGGWFAGAQARQREFAGVARMARPGTMLGLMGIQAGLGLAERAAGEGPAAGIIGGAGRVVGGVATGAMMGMALGPMGAALGGAVGGVTAAIGTIFDTLDKRAKESAAAIAKEDAAREVEERRVLQRSRDLAATSYYMAEALGKAGLPMDVFVERLDAMALQFRVAPEQVRGLVNAMAPLVEANTLLAATMREQLGPLLEWQRALGLSDEAVAEAVDAAEKVGLLPATFIRVLDAEARRAVEEGRARTRGQFIEQRIGALAGARTRGEAAQVMAVPEITGALEAARGEQAQAWARGELGGTGPVPASQVVAMAGSLAALPGTTELRGTGLEAFEGVLTEFAGAGAEVVHYSAQLATLTGESEILATATKGVAREMANLQIGAQAAAAEFAQMIDLFRNMGESERRSYTPPLAAGRG